MNMHEWGDFWSYSTFNKSLSSHPLNTLLLGLLCSHKAFVTGTFEDQLVGSLVLYHLGASREQSTKSPGVGIRQHWGGILFLLLSRFLSQIRFLILLRLIWDEKSNHWSHKFMLKTKWDLEIKQIKHRGRYRVDTPSEWYLFTIIILLVLLRCWTIPKLQQTFWYSYLGLPVLTSNYTIEEAPCSWPAAH